jgi:hypothetical protein
MIFTHENLRHAARAIKLVLLYSRPMQGEQAMISAFVTLPMLIFASPSHIDDSEYE